MTQTITPPAQQLEPPVGWTAVMRLPHCARLLGGTLLGRLPLGMAPVVLLLAVRAEGGTYTNGAILAAAFGLAVAAGQPLLGRIADRYGQTGPLAVGAAVSATAFLILAVAGTADLVLAALAAALAGLASPPLEAALRTLWPAVVPSPRHLRAAYSLDSGSQELVYVAGPLLAAVVCSAAGPSVALAVTGGIGLCGALSTILSGPSRAWRPTGAEGGGIAGALRSPGMRILLLALVAVGAALGALNVGALAAGERHEAAWLAGAMPAALSIGALLGSAAFTARRWGGSTGHQLTLVGAAFALAWLPLCLDPGPYLAVAFSALPGFFFGPLLTCAYLAIDALAVPGTVTESFGWLVSAFGIGTALGTAAAGPFGGSWAVPAVAAALAVVLLHLVRRPLRLAHSASSTCGSPLKGRS
ncbi:MFS transporter [Streptomyces sp. SYSU K21746]